MVLPAIPANEKEENFKPKNNKEKLITLLPETFQRKQVVEVGPKLSLSERTVDDLLRKLVPEILAKIKHGHYRKTNVKK